VKTPIRVLHLEHDAADAKLVENELRGSGLPVDLKTVRTKTEFFKTFESFHPDLVLSDYMIDGRLSGLSVMKDLRAKHPDQPFIFVSWQIHEASVIEVLNAGATDYVFKEQLSRLTLSVHRALREVDDRNERERAQADLRHSEEYFRSLIENASDIILVLDGRSSRSSSGSRTAKARGAASKRSAGPSTGRAAPSRSSSTRVTSRTASSNRRRCARASSAI
jgi:DNA-binding response OmpR family regulator